MSWESCAEQVAERFGMTYEEAFEIVQYVMRNVRVNSGGSGGAYADRYDRAAGTWKRRER